MIFEKLHKLLIFKEENLWLYLKEQYYYDNFLNWIGMCKHLFLSFLLAASHLFGFERSEKVIVIGAGLSGLTCAYRLQEQGFDVELFEARSRVGGRVFTVKIGDNLAELGAQNIRDGGDAENLFNLISEFNLKTEQSRGRVHLTYTEEDTTYDLLELIQNKKFREDNLKSQLQALREKYDNMKDIVDEFFKEDEPLKAGFSFMLSSYEGAPPENLSSYYTGTLYHQLLGGLAAAHPHDEGIFVHEWIEGGNSRLAEKIA